LLRPRGAAAREDAAGGAGGGDGEAAGRVTDIELFFDLVFVFAITQLSHLLLAHLDWQGLGRSALLFAAVWWVWIFTGWVTNWLDPDRLPVRGLLFALMAAGLMLSAAIPRAFGDRGLVFAGAYVFMQVGRSLFMLAALRRTNPTSVRNFQRITAWLSVSGLFWLAGGLSLPAGRGALWLAAFAIELAGPSLGFLVPGLGRSSSRDWNVHGPHLAERCSAFILIAFGEEVTMIGAAFSELGWTAPVLGALAASLIGTAAMWWIYFHIGSVTARERIAQADDPGRLARLAYTYLHTPLVAGIVLDAVADELALAQPLRPADGFALLPLLGGPLLYLVGNCAFRRVTWGRLPLSGLIGIGLLILLYAPARSWPSLATAAAASSVLVLVAAWESLSLRSAHGEAVGAPRTAPAVTPPAG